MKDARQIDLSILIVSYNTKNETLACINSVISRTKNLRYEIMVYDNNSTDGSPKALTEHFSEMRIFLSDQNIGFAKACNFLAKKAKGNWLLLLNPDTEVSDNSIYEIYRFGLKNTDFAIFGGKTTYADGSLNPFSCMNRITPWSAFLFSTGVPALLKRSSMFNPEGIGGWQRDSVKPVDIIVGCFLLAKRSVWEELGGFDEKYWMYGEEADFCLRARRVGYKCLVTPNASIIHHLGLSSPDKTNKKMMVAKARLTLMKTHWPRALFWWAYATIWWWGFSRYIVYSAYVLIQGEPRDKFEANWTKVWSQRSDWLGGY